MTKPSLEMPVIASADLTFTEVCGPLGVDLDLDRERPALDLERDRG